MTMTTDLAGPAATPAYRELDDSELDDVVGGMNEWIEGGAIAMGLGLAGGPVTAGFGMAIGGAMMVVGFAEMYYQAQ